MHHFSRQVEAAWNFRFVTWPIFVIIAEILLWLLYKKNQSGATKSVAPAHSLPPCRFTHLFAAPSAPKIAVLSATSPRSSPGMGSCVAGKMRINFRCATPPRSITGMDPCDAEMWRFIRNAPCHTGHDFRGNVAPWRQISGGIRWPYAEMANSSVPIQCVYNQTVYTNSQESSCLKSLAP